VIESKTFIRVKCDECGKWFACGDAGYTVFETEAEMVRVISDYDMKVIEGKHYHDDCAPPICDECGKAGHWDEDCPTVTLDESGADDGGS